MIYRQAVKMSGMISQLLRMMRLDQGTECIRMEPLDLEKFLRGLFEELAYDGDRLTLKSEENITVLASPDLLSRLIQNLVENAFKYGKPGGHVWVSVYRDTDEILLEVRDNGIGIAPDQQNKVWQRFYQADPARGSESGSGLGLSMVKQIARVHGGYMTMSSVLDAGSSFILHLPVTESIPADI